MSGARVELQDVTKSFHLGEGNTLAALDRVSLEVAAGSVTAVTGPSGSGKSTLLHLIGAMDDPDSGEIRVDDVTVTGLRGGTQAEYRRTIGFVFQRFHLLPALTVLDNVAVPLLPYKTSFDKLDKARELLDAVGLAQRASSTPSRLSGGQQQRVAIARALINDPGLLLADEPTGNLDSTTGAEIMEVLLHLREQRGMTVIVATHDSVIASRCDRIVKLRDGRIVDDVTVTATGAASETLDRITRLDSGG